MQSPLASDQQTDLDGLLTMMVDGFDDTERGPVTAVTQSLRQRTQGALQEAVRRNPAAADILVRLAGAKTLRSATTEMLISVVSVREDLESVCRFVAGLISHPDSGIARTAINGAFNMAPHSGVIQNAIVEAVEQIDASTEPSLAASRVRALRTVPSSGRVTKALRDVLAVGELQVREAALEVLGERTLPDVSAEPTEAPESLSSTSETVSRTDSRSIQLSFIDVVERLAEQMEDTASSEGERATARVIKEYMNVLRAYVDGDSPETLAEATLTNLRHLGERLKGLVAWYAVGKAILDVVLALS